MRFGPRHEEGSGARNFDIRFDWTQSEGETMGWGGRDNASRRGKTRNKKGGVQVTSRRKDKKLRDP